MYELFSEKTLEKAFELKTLPEFVWEPSDGDAVDMCKKIVDGVDKQKIFSEIVKDVPPDQISAEWMNFYITIFNSVGSAGQFNALVLEGEFPNVDVESVLKQSLLNSVRKKKNAFFEFMKRRASVARKLDSVVSRYSTTDRTVETMSVVLKMERDGDVDLFSLIERATITPRVVVLAVDGVYKVGSNPRHFQKAPGCWALLANETTVAIEQTKDFFLFKFTEKTVETEDALVECNLLRYVYSVKRTSNVCYYIPNADVCLWFFMDFLMLECSNVAVCEKSGQRVDKWILKFLFQKTLTARLSQKTVDAQCKTVRMFGSERFALGDTFLKISISKVSNLQDESVIVNGLLKLLTIFHDKRADIEKEYENMLPHFTFREQKKLEDEGVQKSNRLLKLLAPDMFVTDYPRKCLHLPRIVDDDEAEKLKSKNVPLLAFPLKGEGGVKPKWFACNHHAAAPFPGLRKNPLHNNHVFPVLPCCYIGDQSERRGSEYRIYYNNDFKNVKMRKPNEYVVFTTNRCLPENVFGQIPRDIVLLFPSTIFNQYYRLGVSRTLVSCLERATNVRFSATPSDIELNVCRQESDGGAVVFADADPLHLIAYYEAYFKVNIVVFSDAGGSFEFVKRGRASYLSGIRYDELVVVVCNRGTVADNLSDPQFELVVCSTNEDKTNLKTVFTTDQLVSLELARNMFYNIQYGPILENVASQTLDSFGKIKRITFSDGSTTSFEHYRPHPMNVPVEEQSVGNGLLDQFKNVVVQAARIEHAFHYWGREEFLKRVVMGKSLKEEPNRLVLETIHIEDTRTLDRVLALQQRSVKKIADPLFCSQLIPKGASKTDQLVFCDYETLEKHYSLKKEFTHTINHNIVCFQKNPCSSIVFDQAGGRIYEMDNLFQIRQKYVWENGEKIYLLFENKIYSSL